MIRAAKGLRTIKGRLVALISLLLLVVIATLGATSVVVMRHSLIAQTEETLSLANDAVLSKLSAPLQREGSLPPFGDTAVIVPPDGFFVVFDQNKAELSGFFTKQYDYRPLSPEETHSLFSSLPKHSVEREISLIDEGRYLVSVTTVDGANDRKYRVATGIGLSVTENLLAEYAVGVCVAGLLVALTSAVLGYKLVRQELAPLDKVAEISQRVAATQLSSGEVTLQARVTRDHKRVGSETDLVAESVNKLLEHVETSLNARHRVEESMRRFIAEASHELRNPLASIRGYADFYSNDYSHPEEMGSALARIASESKRMSELVDDLLLLARLDAGTQVKAEEVDLTQIVIETTSDIRFAFPKHTWRMQIPDEPVLITSDDGAIRQMLLNLVGNAGRHTQEGTTVTIGIHLSEESIVVSVVDDGSGIPEEALPTIFDRFTQASPTVSTRQSSSVGLGLAIVQAFADALEYKVSVTSGAAGTAFSLKIPYDSARPNRSPAQST